MLVISLATAGTVFTLNIYKSGDKEEPIPLIIQKIFFTIIAKILFINIKVNKNLKLSMSDYFKKRQKHNHKNSKSDETKKPECNDSAHEYITPKEYFHLKTQKIKRNSENHSDTELCRLATDTLSNKILLKASPLITPLKPNNKIPFKSNDKAINNSSNNTINTMHDSFSLSSINDNQPNRLNSIALKSSTNENVHANLVRLAIKKQHRPEEVVPISAGVYNTFNSNNELRIEQRRLSKLIQNLNENLEAEELKDIIQEYKHEIRIQWIQLAKVIDTLMAYLFFIFTFLMFYFLVQELPNAKIF